MIEVTCPKCKKAFRCDRPTEETNYTVLCPYCDVRCRISPQSNIEIAQKVALYEKVANILWLAIGIYQIIIGLQTRFYITSALGVYNIFIACRGLQSVKNIYAGNANVVKWYDDKFIWIIIFAVINLIIGGVIGVFLSLFNLYIRDYVLKHRYAFEVQ